MSELVYFSRSVNRRLIQGFRVGAFALIVLLIHLQHQKLIDDQPQTQDWSELLPEIQATFPNAVQVTTEQSPEPRGIVLDSNDDTIGFVVRTAPAANHIVGFSGPTDLLIIADQDERVVGVRVLSSRDTREHIDQILNDSQFLPSFTGRSLDDLRYPTDIDAVSGATLTSLAILESVRFCLHVEDGDSESLIVQTSLKFPDPPRIEDVQLLYPDASSLESDTDNQHLWIVLDASDSQLGRLLRTSPTADNAVGYQGPTDSLIAFDEDEQVTGVAVGISFDNEPYVDYVREDYYFRKMFNQWNVSELAGVDVVEEQIEGVSGATMTSQTVAATLILTAQAYINRQKEIEAERNRPEPLTLTDQLLTVRNLSTIVITLLGVVIGLTHLRGYRWLRIGFQLLVIVWLGLFNGDMVSQALLMGWAQSGIPWQNAFDLTFLTAAALLIPISTGHNVYCSHVCPHGAAQQLLRNRLPWRVRLPKVAQHILKLIPVSLLVFVVVIGMLHLPISPVDIEPFDAWVFGIAGVATIVIAIVGLVASLFVPMAYCRFGCPTGALLNHLRPVSQSSLTRRDAMTVCLVIMAIVIYLR